MTLKEKLASSSRTLRRLFWISWKQVISKYMVLPFKHRSGISVLRAGFTKWVCCSEPIRLGREWKEVTTMKEVSYGKSPEFCVPISGRIRLWVKEDGKRTEGKGNGFTHHDSCPPLIYPALPREYVALKYTPVHPSGKFTFWT